MKVRGLDLGNIDEVRNTCGCLEQLTLAVGEIRPVPMN